MATFAFAFEEMEGSPKEVLNKDNGFSAVRKFVVPWAHRLTFASGLINSQYPGLSAVRVDDIAIDPLTDDVDDKTITNPELQLNSYENALVVCNYSSTQAIRQDQPDGTYLTYRQSQTAEFLTIPSRALYWQDNNERLPPDASAAILIPKTEHLITWHDVSAPNFATLSDLRGHVNSGSYSIPVIGLSAPAETLLFKGSDTNVKVSTSGDEQWDITVTLSEKKIKAYSASTVYGWNHTYRDYPEGWVRTVNSNGDPTHPTGDLSTLFNQVP